MCSEAASTLGVWQPPNTVALFMPVLDDTNDKVRSAAVQALTPHVERPEVHAAFKRLKAEDPSMAVRYFVRRALR